MAIAQGDCNGGPAVGTPCDDGDPCTLLDEIQSDCTCAGFTDPNDAFTITPSAEKVCGGDSAYFTITGPAMATVSYELDGIGASIELNELGVAGIGLEENLDSTQTAGDIVVLSIIGYTLGQGVGQCAGILYLSDTLVDYNGVNPRIVGKNFFGEDCNDFGFSFQLELDFPAGSTLHFSTNYPVNVVSIIQPPEDSYTTTTGEEFEITRTDGVMDVFVLFDELHLLDINANFNLIVRFDSIDYEGCIAEIAGLIDTTIMPEPEFDLNLQNVGCLYVNNEDYYGQNRPAIEYNYMPKAFPASAQGLSGEFINSIWDDLDFEFEINGAIYHFNEETDFANSVNGNFFELRPRSSSPSGVSDCSGFQCPIMFCLGTDNQVPDPILNDTIRVQPIAVSNANGCRRLFYTGETELILFDTQQLNTDSVLLTCGEDLLLEGNISYEGNFFYDWSVTTYGLPFLLWWLQSPNSSLGNENAIGVTQPGSYFFSANSWDYGCPGFRKEFYVISNSGAPCDDSNPCTINDLYDENCTCAGTFADSDNDGLCDAQEVCENSGTPCDDGDPCTLLDKIQPDCSCSGFTDPNDAFTITPSAEKVCGGDSAYFTITGPPQSFVNYALNDEPNSITLDALGQAVIAIPSPMQVNSMNPDTVVVELFSFEISGIAGCVNPLTLSDSLINFNGIQPYFASKWDNLSECIESGYYVTYLNYELASPVGSTTYCSTNLDMGGYVDYYWNSFYGRSFSATRTDSVYYNFIQFDEGNLNLLPQNSDLIVTIDSIDYGGCVSDVHTQADTSHTASMFIQLTDYFTPVYSTYADGLYRICPYYIGCEFPLMNYLFMAYVFQPTASSNYYSYEPNSLIDFDFEFEINGTIVHFNNFNDNYYNWAPLMSIAIADGVTYGFSLGLESESGPALWVIDGCGVDLKNYSVQVSIVAATGPDGCRHTDIFHDYNSNSNMSSFLLFPTQVLSTEEVSLSCSDNTTELVTIPVNPVNSDYYWTNQSADEYFAYFGYFFSAFYGGDDDTLSINQPGDYTVFITDTEVCQNYIQEYTVTALAGAPCDDSNPCTINDVYDEDCLCAGTYVDNDNDGACDAVDPCPSLPPIGTACDDNNESTVGDVYRPDCVCAGLLLGCTNTAACNYNAQAGSDDGSCITIGEGCDDQNAETINDLILVDCTCAGELVLPIEGCTSSEACNYDATATLENGSCTFVGDTCDDQNAQTINDIITAECSCAGMIPGCTNAAACNFNALATLDDGSCTFAGCMDPLACNYNPTAACDDGSCEEVGTFEITGQQLPSALDTMFYTYTATSGSTYQWSADGGIVLMPDDVAEVGVVWANEGISQLCVQETSENDCVGPQVCLDVIVIVGVVEAISEDFGLYPNPANTLVSLEVAANWVGSRCWVANAVGEIVIATQIQSSRTELNVEGFSAGVYAVELISEDGETRTLRLVVE